MITTYKTIAFKSEGLYKEKGSKFIAYAFPVSSEKEIKEIVATLKKEFHDARHHCFAFRLGADMNFFRSNDDGEPSGTAGKPILGQIQSFGVTNVLIVVVRYFGGTKLGVGGLIQAYREAAKDALAKAEIIEKNVEKQYELEFSYEQLPEVMKTLKSVNAGITKQETGEKYLLFCSVSLINSPVFEEKLKRLPNFEMKFH
ncbi:MAG: IMPACT family protein [Bacteroidota bacterium]